MSQSTPLVTVVTPTYNHEMYLAKCIESVLAQTDGRWEMVLVDDGSVDATQAIALSYDDPRIRYTRQENAGILRLAETLNRAVRTGRGRFIATLSGDDFWPKDKLETQIPVFDASDVVLSWGRVGVVDSMGNVVGTVPTRRVVRRSQRQRRSDTFESLLRRNTIYAASVMFRTDAFRAIGGFQQPHGIPIEDWPTWLELSRRGRFAVLDRVLGFYRRHDAQVTAVLGDEMAGIEDWLESYGQSISADDRRELALDLGIQGSDLTNILDRQGAARSFARGRRLLRTGDTPEARQALRDALPDGTSAVRARALAFLALTRLGVDVESAVEWANRMRGYSTVNRARSGVERRSRRRTR